MAGSPGRLRSLLCRRSAKCCRRARRPVPTRHRKGSRIMTATAIDSAVFRDIFSTEAMRRVFSDENRIQKYLDFEAGLARAQARLGVIPQNACDEIVNHCRLEEIDIAKVKTQTERIGYTGLPGGQQVGGRCW